MMPVYINPYATMSNKILKEPFNGIEAGWYSANAAVGIAEGKRNPEGSPQRAYRKQRDGGDAVVHTHTIKPSGQPITAGNACSGTYAGATQLHSHTPQPIDHPIADVGNSAVPQPNNLVHVRSGNIPSEPATAARKPADRYSQVRLSQALLYEERRAIDAELAQRLTPVDRCEDLRLAHESLDVERRAIAQEIHDERARIEATLTARADSLFRSGEKAGGMFGLCFWEAGLLPFFCLSKGIEYVSPGTGKAMEAMVKVKAE